MNYLSHNVKEGLSRPESRTTNTQEKQKSVLFWLIKVKSCPTNGLQVGMQSIEIPMTNVAKHKLDALTLF